MPSTPTEQRVCVCGGGRGCLGSQGTVSKCSLGMGGVEILAGHGNKSFLLNSDPYLMRKKTTYVQLLHNL